MIRSIIIAASLLAASPALADECQCNPISYDEVIGAQKAWADGIMNISKTFIDKGDYKKAAGDLIHELYNYDHGKVLFKPTLASANKFRETFDQALSYFVKGVVPEDKGFAIKPWSDVRFGPQQIIRDCDSAIAMGKYYFTPQDGGPEAKVEFTFGYIKDKDGKVRINLHHSSLPYQK